MPLHAIVLAAGKGTRMKSDLAKVLHVAAGRTLLDWSLHALTGVDVASIAVVVGHQANAVSASMADHELAPLAATALQTEQLGTGHAAAIGLAALAADAEDTVIVMPGDMPLLRPESLARLVAAHDESGVSATVVSARVSDPTGYGRIKRDGAGVLAIVEQSDATAEEAAIDEINTSVYAFRASVLESALGRLDSDNAQGEQYLTDTVRLIVESGGAVGALVIDATEASGVNTVEQLGEVAQALVTRHG